MEPQVIPTNVERPIGAKGKITLDRPEANAEVSLAAELAKLDRLCAQGRREPFFEKMTFQGDAGKRMILAMLERMGPNRALSTTHAAKITKAINRGAWRLTHQGVAFDTLGKCRDGQHRLNGFLQADPGKVITTWVYFGLDPDAFHNIDVNHLTRRAKHLLSIAKIENPKAAAAMVRVLAIAWNKAGDDEELLNLAQELDKKNPSEEQSIFVTAVKAGARTHKLPSVRSAPMAAAYYHIATHTKRPELLPVFWEKFVTGENINSSNPNVAAIYNLRQLLTTTNYSMPDLRGGSGGWQVVWRQAGAVINAWNAWIAKRRGKQIRWNELAEFPKVEG